MEATIAGKLNDWIETKYRGFREDDLYTVDEQALEELTELVRAQLEGQGLPGDQIEDQLIREILTIVLKEEESEGRALIGAMAVKLLPLSLAAGVIASASILAVVLSGGALTAAGGTLAVAGGVHALVSTVSLLSKDERRVVVALMAAKEMGGTEDPTVQDLIPLVRESGMDEIALASTLQKMVQKDAVTWDGQKESKVGLKKWL